MSEVFVSELVVAQRSESYHAELAAAAVEWFGKEVERISVEVSLRRVDGVLRYVVVGRFRAVGMHARPTGLRRVAHWLGLVEH